MALLTLADIRTQIGYLLVDDDGVITAAVKDAYFNEAYIGWKLAQDNRPRELTTTSTGLQLAANDKSKSITATNIRQILRCWRVTAAGGTTNAGGADLEIAEPWEVRQMQVEDSTTGTPDTVAFYRVGTDTVADVGKWVALFHPIPSATLYFNILAIVEPAKITTTTDSPDVQQGEDYALCRVAAARIALSMGREDAFIAALWQGVPEAMQAALRVQEANKGPRPRPMEAPA